MAQAGEQAFRFVGSRAFGGKGAELSFDLINLKGTAQDHTLIEADLDGDKVADFQIDLAGLHRLVKADFLLWRYRWC